MSVYDAHSGIFRYKRKALGKLHTVKNIRRIYGKIAGNQPTGHVPLFFAGTRKVISHGRIEKSKAVLLTAA